MDRPLEQFKLSIGRVVIHFIAANGTCLKVIEPHSRFLVRDGKPDLTLVVHFGGLPRLGLEEKLFESGGVWALYRSGTQYEFTLSAPPTGPVPYQVAVINFDFERGDVHTRVLPGSLDGPEAKKEGELTCINPTVYPLDEVLVVNLLSRGRGVELHGCGVVVDGKGILFSGVSGAGKSTLANLWKKRPNVLILSDDRIIVRRIDGHFWMFGTPWHGDAKTALPQGVPLEKVCLIKHSPQNYALPLKASDAASRLMVRCFPTFWDQSGMLYTLGLLGEIAEEIPCYELGFVPNESILHFVTKM